MPSQLAVLPPKNLPHSVETDVHRELTSHPGLTVSSLVVRRLANGVCLEGVVRIDDDAVDLNETIRRITGATRVLNRLVVCQDCESL